MKTFLIWFFEPAFRWLEAYLQFTGAVLRGYGFSGHIGYAKETGWGSGTVVASGDYIEALSEDVQLSIERFGYKAIIGSLAEPDDATGIFRVQGGIRFAANPVWMLPFLKSCLHSVVTTSTTGPLYAHAFQTTSGGADFSTEVPNQPYSFEVFRDVGTSMRYTGCLVNALSFEYSPNGPVMCEAQLIGKDAEAIAKTTPTFITSPAKPFNFDTVSLSLGGAGTALIEALTVSINNNLEGIAALNLSNRIAKIRRNNHQMVEISGTLDFINNTEYEKFVQQTEQRMVVHVTRASSFALTLDMPRVVYTAFPVGIPGRERITVDFAGKAFVHQGSGLALKATLTSVQSLK